MVRTYRQDKYQLVSPWEKAMRSADSEEGRPINTGKRVYSDMKVTQTSLEHNSGQKNLKLPPINEDPQQMISFLGEEVGIALVRSKELIKKIVKEFVLYDPSDTGLMSKSSAFEILQRYKVPNNENYQKKILAFFVDQQQPGKINYKNLKEFFENSRKIQQEKIAFSQQQPNKEEDDANMKSDNTRGRYDSTTTNNSVQHKPRKAHKQAFSERRDVALLFEIEKALKNTHKDPEELLEKLEESLRTTCKNDDFLTNNGHVKSLVSKHELPINTALTLKCIERLDPHDIGKIEWPRFMEFLRKAIGASPRRAPQKPSPPQPNPTEYVPKKPAWETRQPLSSISQPSNDMRKPANNDTPQDNEHVRSTWDTPEQQPGSWAASNNLNGSDNEFYKEASAPPLGRDSFTPYNYLADSSNSNINDNLLHNPFDDYRNTDHVNKYEEDGSRQDDYDNQYPTMDDDIEAAFAKNIEEIRKTYQPEEEAPKYNFEGMGERAEIYKRVASALEDKAKPTQGMLFTNDVRKIINYYNLLFDANFPMDQINSMLQQYSNNDQMHSQQIIGMFGKQII